MFNIFIIITRILHVIVNHTVMFMDVFQPFKVAKSKFFNNNNNFVKYIQRENKISDLPIGRIYKNYYYFRCN
jgi:hypothetical protein